MKVYCRKITRHKIHGHFSKPEILSIIQKILLENDNILSINVSPNSIEWEIMENIEEWKVGSHE